MIKFLLIFFIVIYIIGYLGKLFLARWIKKVSNQQNNQNFDDNRKEGEVTINVNQKDSKKFHKDDGDYVDYEEIND